MSGNKIKRHLETLLYSFGKRLKYTLALINDNSDQQDSFILGMNKGLTLSIKSGNIIESGLLENDKETRTEEVKITEQTTYVALTSETKKGFKNKIKSATKSEYKNLVTQLIGINKQKERVW